MKKYNKEKAINNAQKTTDLFGLIAIGKDGVIAPKFKCCVCGKLINEPQMSHAVFNMPEANEFQTQVWIVCNNECQKIVERPIWDNGGHVGWHHLGRWLYWLLENTGYDAQEHKKNKSSDWF